MTKILPRNRDPVKEVFKGLFKGAKFCIVIGTLVLSAHGHDL